MGGNDIDRKLDHFMKKSLYFSRETQPPGEVDC